MNIRSRTFDFAFGLAFMAITPLVVGTWFLNAPAVADDGYSSDPCTSAPTSEDCEFHTDWLRMHNRFWSSMWDQPYQHSHSFMSADPPTDPASSVWPVKVWLDFGFDYSNPSLTFETVQTQIVAQGELDLASWHLLGEVAQPFADPDDPNDNPVLTRTTTIWAVAATATGSTGLCQPVLAALTRTHVADTTGNEQSVYHFNLLQVPQTLAEAVAMAQELYDVVQDQDGVAGGDPIGAPIGGGPGEPLPPPGSGLIVCWSALNGATMPAECCWCYADKSACYDGCRGVFRSAFADCLPSWETILTGFGCATCAALIVGGQWSNPVGQGAIIITCGICLGGLAYTLAKCYLKAKGEQLKCQANCDHDWLRCLQENECDLPSP